MEVLDTKWSTNSLTPNGTIGTIKAKNEAGDIHIYVGTVDGLNEKEDIKRILNWGSKYKLSEFQQFMK